MIKQAIGLDTQAIRYMSILDSNSLFNDGTA
jgi:hypothetical protein